MADDGSNQIGPALVDFALHGRFPEEDVSSRQIVVAHLAPALESLSASKAELEREIHEINEETAPDVDQWVANATSLQNDINRTRTWANEIVRRSEAPDVSGETIREEEEKVEFLRRESAYNRQVHGALTSIKQVNELLDQVERAREERRILDSLRLLEKSWTALDGIPISRSCRVMRILDMRAFELKSSVHEVLDFVWNSLVHVDVENGSVAILSSLKDEPMTLDDAVVGLKAYKEAEQRMALLWHGIDEALIRARTNIQSSELPTIQVQDSALKLSGKADRGIESLFSDLEKVLSYLSERLPEELVRSLSNVMTPELVPRIISTWLDSEVPSSLTDMDGFQRVVTTTRQFCGALRKSKFSGYEEFQEWVDSAPRVWSNKCRETALDSVRFKLSQGLGDSKEIERVETQTVSQQEGQKLTSNGVTTSGDDDAWSSAWDDGETGDSAENGPQLAPNEDDVNDAWGWGEDDDAAGHNPEDSAQTRTEQTAEEDAGDAWGWGDDETTQTPSRAPDTAQETHSSPKKQTREVTLKETYNISSMPEPVLALISTVLEDGASLVGSTNNPMAAAAADLFSLPTLILAMFRAISPYYYSIANGGNMFLYNDATYLSERLSDLSNRWKARDGLAPRAKLMLRLGNDIKTLHSFAARAYASEMTTQRTLLRDLLGGSQNLLQQDGIVASDIEAQVDNATGHIRAIAANWSKILAKSAWNQAVGSLVNTVAEKLVVDVMDLSGIGQDDAYNIANLISRVTALDDLFLPPGAANDGNAVPSTAEYAASWLRLKYLSEVLQSNLQDVRFLWLESELSLYFTVDEVIELIGLSFVENARTREVVREIEAKPNPLGQ